MPFSEKQELARNMLRDLAEESRKLQEIASSPTATSEQKQAAQEAKTTLASFASEFHSAGLISTAELEQYKNAFSKVEELRTEKKIDEKISSVLPKDSVKLSTEAGGKEQYASFDKRETGKTSFDSILTIDAEKNQVSEKIASSKSGYSVSIDYPLEAGKDSAKLQEKLQRTERSKKNLEGIVEEYKELDTLSQDPEVLDSIPKEASAKQEDIRTLQSKKDRTPLEEKRLRKYILEEKKSRLVESGAPKNTEDLQGYVQSIEKQIADIHNQLKTAPNTPNTSKESLKNNAREIVEFMDTIGLSYLGEKNADTVLLEMYKKSDGGEGKLPIKLTDGNPPKIDASNKMEADAKTRIQKMFAEYLGKAAAFDQNTNPPTIKELDESGKTIDFRAKFISAGILDVDGNLKKHVGSEEK